MKRKQVQHGNKTINFDELKKAFDSYLSNEASEELKQAFTDLSNGYEHSLIKASAVIFANGYFAGKKNNDK